MIEFRSVTKRFPDGTVAVDELDLVAEDGRITVFVGPSGCGKTTSLRMVNRMIDPTSGTVSIDGADVTSRQPAELRRGIGYVIQQAGLFPHRTVLDNVATVPRLTGATRRAARSRAAELLDLVGLSAEAGRRYPAQLSGGQQQRVGVARALAADPPVLLMDEPFSAVDPVVRDGLQEELLRLQGELGKTILFVTHDIDEAIKVGDVVAVLREGGRLAQYAPPAELLARPADDFVAGFVGRDRGYRGLGFLAAEGVPVRELARVEAGTQAGTAKEQLDGGWAIVVDTAGRPVGWIDADTLGRTPASTPVEGDLLAAGGSIYDVNSDGRAVAGGAAGSLRSALDAALSSPSGLGVAVDRTGTVVGAVVAEDVLAALAAARRAGEVPS
jgi:osmoprotectant transport system ATP-binding protein